MDQTLSTEIQDINIGKEIAKGIAVSFAIQAGSMAAFLAVGYAYSKYLDHKEKKAQKTTQTES